MKNKNTVVNKSPAFTPENVNEIFNAMKQQLEEKASKMKHVNIIITGKTGVGKSTLINSVFRENLATTGYGKPVTQETKVIQREDMPIRIYDTKGLELGKGTQTAIKDDIFRIIDNQLKSANEDNFIHVIWYCINTTSDRIEEDEIKWINELATQNNHNVPVIIVLTKTLSMKKGLQFKELIEKMDVRVNGIVPVLAQSYEMEFDDGIKTLSPFGLTDLVDVTLNVIPDSARDAFINCQNVNLDLKIKRARKWLAGYAATNFAAGFVPIPFADAPVLISTEVAMLAQLTVMFGISVEKATLTAVASALVGCSGATIAGKLIVTNLLKLIPGVGTVIGGAISGSTAALLTTALGEAYIVILTRIAKGEIKKEQLTQKEMIDEMKRIFKEKLQTAK